NGRKILADELEITAIKSAPRAWANPFTCLRLHPAGESLKTFRLIYPMAFRVFRSTLPPKTGVGELDSSPAFQESRALATHPYPKSDSPQRSASPPIESHDYSQTDLKGGDALDWPSPCLRPR